MLSPNRVLTVLLIVTLLAVSPLDAGASPSSELHLERGPLSIGACTPQVHLGGGRNTCYLPSQIQEAQAQFPVPPLDPSPTVHSLTGLQLVQILSYKQMTLPRRTRLLLYVYGKLPPIGQRALYGSAPFPPPRVHPRYTIVEEALGRSPGLPGLFLGRSTQLGPDGKTPTAYGAWQLTATFPHRDLQLTIVSDATKALTRRIGKAIIAIDANGPVVPSPFVRLSLSTPAATYPRDALVRVTVQLRNVSTHAVHLVPPGCGSGSIRASVLNAAGRIVYPPILPGSPSPSCGVVIGRGQAVAPGQTVRTQVLVVMRGWRLQAEADIAEVGTVLSKPQWIRLTGSDVPDIVIETQPSLHADLSRPRGATGHLWYFAWSQCPNAKGEAMVGMFGWRPTAGTRLFPLGPPNCTGTLEWHALAGWLGHSVAHVDQGSH